MQPNLCFSFSVRMVLWVFLFLCPLFIFSQATDATISGTVKDAGNKPVKYASIALLNFPDSLIIKSTTCNAEGAYRFTGVKNGKYILHASAIGYQTGNDLIIEIVAAKSYHQDILLATATKTLADVKVLSRKPPIQIKADRTILNVAASINVTGSSVFELLAKVPGVRIVNNEDILLNGKRGLAVYLDGKLLQLQGREIIDFLQTLSSANIEQIEMITHPSARYDAAGNAGIINIRTKKNLNVGFNGSVTLTGIVTNYKPKGEGNTNLNYRQKQYSLYGTYSYNGGNYKNALEDTRAQVLANTGITNFSQHYQGTFSRQVHNYRAGADYFLSKRSTLGFVLNGGYTNWIYKRNSTTDIYQSQAKIDSQLISKTIQPKDYRTQNYNLNYLYHDTLGHELNIDASYGSYKTSANSNQSNRYIFGPTLLRFNANTSNNFADITIAAVKADYTQKLWKGILTVGIKWSDVQSDNDLLFYNIINSEAKPDTGRTNHFVYTEKIAAAYFDYSFNYKKFDFQTGLRLEHTASNGSLTTILNNTSKAVDTSYTKLFPNLVINYKANENNNIGLAMSRRINRPAYQTLNPFEFVLDELSYTKGNPFLKPQTAYDIKLSHSFKSIFSSSASFTVIDNYFLGYRDTLAGGKTFSSTINAGTQKFYSLNSSVQLNPKSWWDVFASAESYYQTVNGLAGNQLLKMGQFSWSSSASSTFRFGKWWSTEVSGYYNSGYLDAPALVTPQWSVDAGIQRKVLNESGVIRFNVTDVFGSLQFSLNRNFGGLYYRMYNKWESRQFRLSFNYKFGNKNVKASRSRNNSAAEEQRRVGQ